MVNIVNDVVISPFISGMVLSVSTCFMCFGISQMWKLFKSIAR